MRCFEPGSQSLRMSARAADAAVPVSIAPSIQPEKSNGHVGAGEDEVSLGFAAVGGKAGDLARTEGGPGS